MQRERKCDVDDGVYVVMTMYVSDCVGVVWMHTSGMICKQQRQGRSAAAATGSLCSSNRVALKARERDSAMQM